MENFTSRVNIRIVELMYHKSAMYNIDERGIKNKKLSKENLAKILNTQRDTLSRIFSGERVLSNPSLKLIGVQCPNLEKMLRNKEIIQIGEVTKAKWESYLDIIDSIDDFKLSDKDKKAMKNKKDKFEKDLDKVISNIYDSYKVLKDRNEILNGIYVVIEWLNEQIRKYKEIEIHVNNICMELNKISLKDIESMEVEQIKEFYDKLGKMCEQINTIYEYKKLKREM